MNKKLSIILSLIFIITSINTFAQLKVDGSFRTRLSAMHGYKMPAAKETNAIFSGDQQSRIILNYKKDKLKVKFTLQDARVWGSDDFYNATGPQRNSFALGVHEAWFELLLSDKNSLRIGRQEWNYNQSRLLSHRGWWTTGLSYDALLFKRVCKDKGLAIDLGISYNNDMNTTNGMPINAYAARLKTVNFLNVKKNFSKKLNLTFSAILTGKQHTTNADILYMKATEGLILNYNFSKKKQSGLFANASVYYQHGANANTTSGYSKTSAYMFDAQIGIITMENKLSVALGMEMLSGHDQTNTDTDYNNEYHNFDILQGGCHPYYGGELDLFVLPKHTKNGGLMDPYIRTSYKLNKTNMLKLNVFLPMLATNVKTSRTDANNEAILYDKFMGVGIDLGYVRKVSENVKLSIVGSLYNGTDSWKEMRGLYTVTNNALDTDNAGLQYMVYTTIVVTPNFFKSANKK